MTVTLTESHALLRLENPRTDRASGETLILNPIIWIFIYAISKILIRANGSMSTN